MDMQQIERAYQAGFALHQQGDLVQAAGNYEQLITLLPDASDLPHLLGVLRHQQGDHSTALPLIQRAIELEPGRADFHCNLGMVLNARGDVLGAEASYRRALDRDPDHADALANLGGLLQLTDQVHEAKSLLERAIALNNDHPIAWMNLGNILSTLGELDAAESAQARAVGLAPSDATARMNLASTLMSQQRTDQAEPVLRAAAMLDPGIAEVWNNLGYVHMNSHAFDAAARCFRHASEVQPLFGAPHAGLADICYLLGRPEDALVHSNKAVALMPANPQIRFRRSMHLLGAGRIAEGWDARDARLEKPDSIRREGAPPDWTGEDLKGRRILIGAEEGVGDEILFAQCFNEVISEAAHCFIECDPRILPVFQRSFPTATIAPSQRGGTKACPTHGYDWLPDREAPELVINAGSLQRIYRRDLADYDNRPPYLKPDTEKVDQWRRTLAARGDGLKVGICWRSRSLNAFRNVHYTDLTDWDDLLRTKGVTFVSLQYGEGWREEVAAANQRIGDRIHILEGVNTTDDFDTMFAVVTGLDLVICPSSTASWIAGSMGVPAWCLITRTNFVQLGTDHFPGFPSMRSHDRISTQLWDPIFERLRSHFEAMIRNFTTIMPSLWRVQRIMQRRRRRSANLSFCSLR
jgi:Tfp pilus assembly protein PilF